MASGRIKGITIEIEGKTEKLASSLKAIDSQLNKTQRSLKDTNKLLKMDPGNADLLRQKQKQLEEAIKRTKTRLEQLKEAQSKVDEGSAEWDAIQREIVQTEQELKKLEKEYRNFGSVSAQQIAAAGEKLKGVGTKMSEIGQGLTTKVTAPLVAAGAVGAKKFAEVDKTMQLTNKTMGNSKQQADLLNQAMKDAAANSTFGMNDAATASLNFARAGLKAEQAAALLGPAMNLAAGEGGNLDTVSAGLVATINGFGDSFGKAGKYADIFANACNNSALDIDTLSDSMKIAAPIFKTAGYSVKDAALYLGVMANAGINANEGANALKTGLARLVSPSKQAAEAMDDLNISVTNQDGTMKDTLTIQKELHEAFKGLSESEQIAAASAIFGKNQMSKWLALINTAPEDVAKLSAELDKEGTTAEMADAMMSGFGGSMEKLKSSVDVAATSLGEALAPTILKVANGIQKAVDWFNSLDEKQRQLIAKIGLIAAAIGPVLLIGGKLLIGVGQLMTYAPKIVKFGSLVAKGFKLARTAVAALTFNPVLLGIAAAIAAGILIWKNWDKIKAKAAELKKAIQEKWEGIKTAISTKIDAAKTAVTTKVEAIKTAAITKFESIRSGAASKFESIRSAAASKFESVRSTVAAKTESARSAAASKFESIRSAGASKFESLRSAAASKFESIRSTAASKFESARSSAAAKFESMRSTAVSKFESIKSGAATAFGNIATTIGSKLSTAKDKVAGVISAIKNKFPFSIGKIISFNLPTISLKTGSKTVLGKTITYPTGFSVNWHRRAYNMPIEFTRSTIIPTANGLHGFGDGPGSEVVYGRRKLAKDVASIIGERGRDVTINVYAREGMDVRELANEVGRVLIQTENRKRGAWA